MANPPSLDLEPAFVLANGGLRSVHSKTAHGLLRRSARFEIKAVIAGDCQGQDAGEVLDGRRRNIPVTASLADAMGDFRDQVGTVIVGTANHGGFIPPETRPDILVAAQHGMKIVSGLHQLLCDWPELVQIASKSGAQLVDVRRPKPFGQLRFWTGEVVALKTPRVAVMGTDCAVGKRTTMLLLAQRLGELGLRPGPVHTGQTGWLQGIEHGFILDATPNDFVCGELEGAILACARDLSPDVILIEGQSALRNPSGPCGAEFLCSALAQSVVLQHDPGRRYFDGCEAFGLQIPSIPSEIDLIASYGAEVLAVTLKESLDEAQMRDYAAALQAEVDVPVVRPFRDGVDAVARQVCTLVGTVS